MWYSIEVTTSDSGVPKDPDPSGNPSEEGGFDAVKAAQELAASLGMATDAASTSDRAYEDTLEREVEELNLLIDQKDGSIAALKTELAETATARDRAQEEITRAGERIAAEEKKKQIAKSRKTLLNFLEVLDDFDRALEALDATLEKGGQPDSMLDGIEIVQRSFILKFAELGVTKRPALDEKFDPENHEAVTLVAVDDPAKDGFVVGVIREGYSLGEGCLRPARVAVGMLS